MIELVCQPEDGLVDRSNPIRLPFIVSVCESNLILGNVLALVVVEIQPRMTFTT